MPIPARSRITTWPVALPILLALPVLPALPAAAADCDGLGELSLPRTGIVAAASVAAGTFEPPGRGFGRGTDYAALPEFCRVEAIARPTANSAIGIEVWLPATGWNGKLIGVGNGAWGGSFSHSALADAVAAGYAAASTDTGHRGFGADFLDEHPDKLVDFAHRAVHEMTATARAVTAAFYERPHERAYFSGCSTGGLQALMTAQRYPDDYDGIVAGDPNLAASRVQGMQIYTAAISNRSDEAMLTDDDFSLINETAIAACDTLDGIADGVIEDPRRCSFDSSALACRDAAGQTGTGDGAGACLAPAQIETVRRIYQGPTTIAGLTIFPGLEPGSEAGWDTLSGTEPMSLALETYERLVYADEAFDWRAFDAETDIATAIARIGPLMDANDPDLSDFVERGGRLLLYHGWSDPGIPPGGSIRYYEAVRALLGPERTDAAVRLFMVPGMGHCGGGTGTDRFDAIAALDAWLETDRAPARIEAERVVDGETLRTRPLCPYPTVAVYAGTGSTDDAASFSCR